MSKARNGSMLLGAPSRFRALPWLGVLLLGCLLLPGCGGCQKQQTAGGKGKADAKANDQEKLKKKAAADRPPLELGRLQIQPYDEDSVQFFLKPGHWISTLHSIRANHEDVQADLESVAANKAGEPVRLERAPFQVTASRPVALPKGQLRTVESFYFVPRDATSPTDSRLWLQRRLVPRVGARRELLDQQPCLAMPDYQFYFLVLASNPDQYAFVKRLHSVAPPGSQVDVDERSALLYYRVFVPRNLERGVPLPTHPLAWTSTACILWDGIYPNALNPSQQQAMLDWLHWGGQLIISGPGTLERLKGSFLEPYLPVSSSGAAELTADDFQELDENWSLALQVNGERQSFPINTAEKMLGTDLQPTSRGQFADGCGRLVCEAQVGTGRIVVTAFSLHDRHVLSWRCFDSFFNGCLLRRPPREYKPGLYPGEPELVWAQFPSLARDPLLVSKLRYLSRDAVEDIRPSNRSTANAGAAATRLASLTEVSADAVIRPRELWRLAGYSSRSAAGVAAWNDLGSVSRAARDTLKQAAGITIPEAKFVLRILGIYLVLLVPVNWLVFRLLGRVEWAWVAAPIMGITASIIVVRMAQLDIGFARSRTEVATLEVHSGYSRGHLARYTALYTSLTTNYMIESENDTAVMLPFSTDPNYEPRIHDRITNVGLRRESTVRLSGFPVISNSTGIVHSEQMHDLGGSIQLVTTSSGGWQLENSSEIELRDAVVLRRTLTGELQVALQNTVRSKATVPVDFQTKNSGLRLGDLWSQSPVMSGRNLSQGEVGLQMLADVAVQQLPLLAGETRLVAWSDQVWKGFRVRPEASQSVTRTLVVVHLDPGPLPPARRDANLLQDVEPTNAENPLTDEDIEGVDILPQNPAPEGDGNP